MARERNRNRRLQWLVGVHLVLAAAPLLGLLFPFSMETLPIEWAFTAAPVGGLMTLSVWVGMGRARVLWRVAAGLAASCYVTIWPFVCDTVRITERMRPSEWIMHYLESVTPFSIVVLLFGGMFMLIGRRFKLAHVKPREGPPRDERIQFSVLQMMVVMSLVAVILTLLRATRGNAAPDGRTEPTWQWVAANLFMFIIFFVNTACAAFAALWPGNVKRNIGMVLLVSVLLGASMTIAMRQDDTGWWLFVGSTFIVIIPTVTVLASLLVVRSCGFRLIRRSSAEC